VTAGSYTDAAGNTGATGSIVTIDRSTRRWQSMSTLHSMTATPAW
jgi:hypothetical protein